MILMEIKNKNSAILSFDDIGIVNLIGTLEKSLNCNTNCGSSNEKIKICRNESDSTLNFTENNTPVIELDTDEVEYFIERLRQCRVEHQFFPAEIADVVYKRKSITIYAKYIGS